MISYSTRNLAYNERSVLDGMTVVDICAQDYAHRNKTDNEDWRRIYRICFVINEECNASEERCNVLEESSNEAQNFVKIS